MEKERKFEAYDVVVIKSKSVLSNGKVGFVLYYENDLVYLKLIHHNIIVSFKEDELDYAKNIDYIRNMPNTELLLFLDDVCNNMNYSDLVIWCSEKCRLNIKLWIDDIRPVPKGYIGCKSVNEAISIIQKHNITLIDIDHDAGDYVIDGGDYIKVLDWLEMNNYNYPIRIHSMNPVGIENMRKIIRKNGWIEIK